MGIQDALEPPKPPSKMPPPPPDTQRTCIDLPGETARCYLYKSKLQVVLRKHRDVIFDIDLGIGSTYTVEADESDFYNARDKKLVEHKRKHKVTFKDGERLHLWVSRNFKGNLLLKSDGKLLARYEPNAFDPTRYDEDPKTKPAPLIVVMKLDQPAAKPTSPTTSALATTSQCTQDDPLGISKSWKLSPFVSAFGQNYASPLESLTSGAVEPQHPTVVVVDGDDKGIPAQIRDYFATGGDKSGLAEVDPNEVATRNWLLGQLAGNAAYAGENWEWLRHSINRQANGDFKLVKANMSYVNGKVRFYFSGYSRVNPAFGPGGHGPGNAKILQIYGGAGETASTFKAVAKGIGGTFKGYALLSFIFGSATTCAEWKADAKKDGYDLAASLLTTLIKAIVVAALTVVTVALAVIVAMIFFEIAVAALVVGALTLVAGFFLNYLVEAGDKKAGKAWKGKTNSDGLAAGIAPWLRSTGKWIGETWDYLIAKMPNDYRHLVFP